jgi:hypothetical protein
MARWLIHRLRASIAPAMHLSQFSKNPRVSALKLNGHQFLLTPVR